MPRNRESLQYQFIKSINTAFEPGRSKYQDKCNPDKAMIKDRIYSYQTKENLCATAKDFSKFCKHEGIKSVKDITSNQVNLFLKNKIEAGANTTTVKQYESRIKTLSTLVGNQYHTSLDWKSSQIYGSGNKMRDVAMKENDYERIIDNSGFSHSKIAVQLSHAFGLRVSETVHIRPSDINQDYLHIHRSKGGKSRDIPIRTTEQKNAVERLKQLSISDKKPCLRIKSASVNKWLNAQFKKHDMKIYLKAKTNVHSIRKNYAQREYIHYRNDKSLSHKETWGKVSMQLGHGKNRKELFGIYCPDFR